MQGVQIMLEQVPNGPLLQMLLAIASCIGKPTFLAGSILFDCMGCHMALQVQ